MIGFLGLIGWILFCLIIILIAWSLTPWWLTLTFFVGGIFFSFFLMDSNYLRRSIAKERSKKVKKLMEQQKKSKAQKNKKRRKNKAKIDSSTTNIHAISTHNKTDYDNYRSYREEQAAYDDYIASLDMNND